MQPRYFFEDEQALEHVFVLYGNTNDFYTTLTNGWYSVAPLLESHLKSLGYEVVVFYNGGTMLRCFDRQHAENLRKYFPTRGAHRAAAPEDRDEKGKDGGAGDVKPGTGTIKHRRPPQPVVGRKANDPEKAVDEAPLRFEYSADKIPDYLDSIMNDSSVKSAVIFGNAGLLLENSAANARFASYISSWYGLFSNNRNIAILLFQERNLVALPEQLRTSLVWRFLYENVFAERNSEALIHIGAPGEDEIGYLLSTELPGYRNPVWMSREGIRQSDIFAAGHRLVLQNGRRLTSLKSFLDRHGKNAMQALLDRYGPGSEEDAMEHIHNTEGWEPIYDVVKRIVDNARNGHRTDVQRATPGNAFSNLRMAFSSGTSHYDVNLSMVLMGNPGTGKTTAVRWIGEALRQNGLLPSGHVVKVVRDDLVAGYVGQTAIKTRGRIEEALGGVLFVDETYQLYRGGKDRGDTVDFGIEAIDTILEAMTAHRGEFCVIFAGYPKEMNELLAESNSGLIRRFDGNIIQMPEYTADLLERIALRHIDERNRKNGKGGDEQHFLISPELALPEGTPLAGQKPMEPMELLQRDREDRKEGRDLCPFSVYFDNWYADRDERHFGNAGAAIELTERLMSAADARMRHPIGDIAILKEDFDEGTEKLFECRTPTLAEIERQMKDVVGMDEVKEALKRVSSYMQLVMAQRQAALALKTSAFALPGVEAGNYLFVGNPGVGKTLIAKKLALTLSSLHVIRRYQPIRVTGLDLIKRVEQGGIEALNKFIQDCRGSVLVIDEAHQLSDFKAIGSSVVKSLLDPMIDMQSEMCFVFCCYPGQQHALLQLEQGLARRITDVFIFNDYKPKEVLEIFLMKAKKASYIVSGEVETLIRQHLTDMYETQADLWENGGTAEKLLKEIRVSMGRRLLTGTNVRNLVGSITGIAEMADLYTIRPEDVEEAFGRMLGTLMLKRGKNEAAPGD